jgi:hypothetical protein
MPQSTKDAAGGKSHPSKSSGSGQGQAKTEKKSSEDSPTGPKKHGEKKTTP